MSIDCKRNGDEIKACLQLSGNTTGLFCPLFLLLSWCSVEGAHPHYYDGFYLLVPMLLKNIYIKKNKQQQHPYRGDL